MNYPQRINRVIDFIGKHLDEDELNLGQLSGVACFSKYHFHRLFKAYTGLSLQQYIRWLRLKRAAHQLVYALYRDWLPGSKEELGDLPCVFCYYNFDHEVAETELLTECWLLLK